MSDFESLASYFLLWQNRTFIQMHSSSLCFNESEFLQTLLNETDDHGQTSLHYANSCSKNYNLIAQMLIDGANPLIRNEKQENFLTNYRSLPNEWFLLLKENRELLSVFINLKAESVDYFLEVSFKRMKCLDENKHDCSFPLDVAQQIFHQRSLLEKAYKQLLAWHSNCHENSSSEIRECCYKNVDPTIAYNVFSETEKMLKKPISFGYYVKKSFSLVFLMGFFLRLVDFSLDIAVHVNMLLPESSTPMPEYCSTELKGFRIPCFYHHVDKLSICLASLLIFVIIYVAEISFVMNNDKTKHYRASINGYCCWPCYNNHEQFCSPKLLIWIFIPMLNQLLIYVYAFWMKTFVAYWRLPLNTKVSIHSMIYCIF